MSQYIDWGSDTTLVNAQDISDGADHTSSAVDLDQTVACEVGVEVVYPDEAVSEGAKIYVCRVEEATGPTYEVEADEPWGFEMLSAQDTTYRRVFNIDPQQVSKFKILITFDGGTTGDITVTVTYRTATVGSS
jgi:hypothetical protein